MINMRRREFITLLGGAAAWPLASRAQQPSRNRKIGVLHPGQAANVNMRIAAFREGLSEPDNRREADIEMVVRLADGDLARLPALATDLVANRVDAILAAGPPAVQAARGATATIPVTEWTSKAIPWPAAWSIALRIRVGTSPACSSISPISAQNVCNFLPSPF